MELMEAERQAKLRRAMGIVQSVNDERPAEYGSQNQNYQILMKRKRLAGMLSGLMHQNGNWEDFLDKYKFVRGGADNEYNVG